MGGGSDLRQRMKVLDIRKHGVPGDMLRQCQCP